MDLKGYVLSVLLVGLVITTVGLIVSDLETQYPDVDVNTSSWAGKWNYVEDINDSVDDLKTSLEKLGDEEVGWFTKLVEGALAIPWAVIKMISTTLFFATTKGIIIISEIGLTLGLPPTILAFGIVALIVIIVFKLMQFWRRYKT